MTTEETIINGCSNPFTEHQRQMLKDLSNTQEGRNYAQENRMLEDYLETLRDMYPEKFHITKKDLDSRVFFDEPTSLIPHARSLRSRSMSPLYFKI